MSHQPGREEYTVGWVCALAIELVAARSMLDKRYNAPDPEEGEECDDTYYMGSIAGHNVVIACLPCRLGTTSAAVLATRMQAKFRGIRLRLMVGIGGGVPSQQADIRLGDVVVSVPQHTFGGVVQYDMGKTTPTDVTRTGSLASPPQALLSAATALQSDILMGESKLLSILSATERIPCLRRCGFSDVLYDANYDHQNGPTCADCDSGKQVVRSQRLKGQEVVVHHGTIASGNQVMKSAVARDKISQKLGGVLCFEMEAAGLMNDFPCIVIRGISDYADSHKNDHWQGYAAGTAAAYAKELLLKIPPAQVTKFPRADETMKKRNAQSPEANSAHSKRRKIGDANNPVLGFEEETSGALQDRTRKAINENRAHQSLIKHQAYQPLSGEKKQQFLDSLRFDQIDERKHTIKRAHTKTCKWLLNNKSYLDWLDATKIQDHHGVLWIKGKAGAGKSTLMKFALERISKGENIDLALSFFFNARGSELEKSTIGAYRSLLLQLLIAFPDLQDVFGILYTPASSFGTNRAWSVESLKVLLEEAIQRLENVSVVCFIDALDECDQTEIQDTVQFFEHIADLSIERNIRFLICFSSRHYPHVTISNGLELVLDGQEGHDQDITYYIETELKIGKSKKAQQIRTTIQEKAAGIFMWVVLVIGILNKESNRGRVDRLQQKLREIPGDLHDLFRDILTRDSSNKQELVLCIQWVLFAKEALRPEQLYHAILSGVEPDAVISCDSEEITQESIKRFILYYSKGLTDITASKTQKVQFIHESVRDFLLKEEGLSKIWPEYKENFLGQSHERLKQSSLQCLKINLEKQVEVPECLLGVSSSEAKSLCNSVQRQFPFLEYAVKNVFYHADQAEGHKISQATFTKSFQLARWIRLHNIFEICKSRKYRKNVSLLYVLAELNCANLIRSHLPLDKVLTIEEERYGCPLFAACALGNNATTEALSSAIEPVSASRDMNSREAECNVNESSILQLNRRFRYSTKRGLLFNASPICPEWLMIQLLESPEYASDVPPNDIQDILKEACRRGHTMVVEKLLDDHQFLSDGEPSSQDQGLYLAAKNGHESTVKLLVLMGADIDVRIMESTKRNPIHIATIGGFESITMFLLDERPDLMDSTSHCGETPLLLAVEHKHASLAKTLVLKGADIHFGTKHGGRILRSASRRGLKDIVILLLDRGADINGQNDDHESPLQAACWGAHEDTVELLLERGADPNVGSGDYANALQIACYGGQKSITERLLNKGANINVQGGVYGTALQAACSVGNVQIVELLLERGADVNAQSGEFGNALQAASSSGCFDIVEILLKRGADVNAHGGKYGNALNAAKSAEIVELLKAYGARVRL